MEYHGPEYSYLPDREPRLSEKIDDFLVKAHPFVMPFIIMAVGLCLAIAADSAEKKGGKHDAQAAPTAQAADAKSP